MGKKATFVLDESIIEQAKKFVEIGRFKSMNAFVETALRDEIERIRKEQIKKAIIDASNDPLFLSDIREIQKDFEHADFEEAGR